MVAPLLFVDNRGAAGVCTCYRYVGTTPSQVGTTFGVRWPTYTSQTAVHHGAAFFQGNLYALAQDGVYVKDDPTTDNIADTWTQAIAFTNSDTAKPRTSGLHVVYINDAPVLVVVFGDPAGIDNSWRWVKFDGTTWTQAASATTATGMGEIHAVAVYRNVIHMIGSSGSGSNAMTFDPASDSFATIAEVFGTSQYAHCMAVFNDRLFGVHNLGNVCRLVEFAGGSWVDVPGGVGLSIVTGNYFGKWALWTDGTYMYGMVPSVSAHGWRVLQWDSSLGAPTNLTATVLPSSLRSTTDGGTYGGGIIQNASVFACGDQDTDPTVADVWLFMATTYTSGTPYSLYKWNGPAALVGNAGVADDSGGDRSHSIPSTQLSGGERIWSAGKLDAWVSGKVAVAGAQRTKFRAAGAAGAADKTVKLYYNSDNEPPILQAKLTGVGVLSGSPAGSPSLGTNAVLNVDADPTVEYYADWNLTADGFTSGDRAQLKPVVTV